MCHSRLGVPGQASEFYAIYDGSHYTSDGYCWKPVMNFYGYMSFLSFVSA